MMFYIVASCKFAKAAIYHVPDEAMMPLLLKMSLKQKNTHILYLTNRIENPFNKFSRDWSTD